MTSKIMKLIFFLTQKGTEWVNY